MHGPIRSTIYRSRRAAELVALAVVTVVQQGCGSNGNDEIGGLGSGSLAVSLGSKTMSLAPGDSGTVTVTLTRVDINSDIALTVENLPAGVTAVFDPPNVSGTTSALRVRATASAAPGNHDLLVRGTASGGKTATQTLSLSVTTATSQLAFKSVVVGGSTTCALTTTGAAYCWGGNRNGQVGNGNTSPSVVTPTAVSGGFTFESLGLPDIGTFACGLRDDGTAYCWGSNFFGQLGDGTIGTDRSTPTAVAGGLKLHSLSVGEAHVCGLTADSVAHCWGDNGIGAFGDGTIKGSASPVAAAPDLRLRAIAAGGGFTCGLTGAGAGYCWGSGGFGVLGNGGVEKSLTPVGVAGGLSFDSIANSGFDTCALSATGEAYCWGQNFYGNVGDGTTTQRSVPTAVAGGLRFTNLRMGYEHACAVAVGGAAYCWGVNSVGSLGDGTQTQRLTPTPVLGGLKFQNVSIGDSHACGVTEMVGGTNDIYCWGQNSSGELGDGTTTASGTPRKVRWPQ
ncbi:MAG: hypothetical protein ABJF01_14740 [bacterium]